MLAAEDSGADVWDALTASSSADYAQVPAALASAPEAAPFFRPAEAVAVPPAVRRQAAAAQAKSFMGLLPDIGRAWLTADARLFLWHYDGQADDFVVCVPRPAPGAGEK